MQSIWYCIDFKGEEKSALGICSTILSLCCIIFYLRPEHSQKEESPWISTGVMLLTLFGWNKFTAIIFRASVPTTVSTTHTRAQLLSPPSLLLSGLSPGTCPGFLPTRTWGSTCGGSTSPSRQPTFVMECTPEHSKSKLMFSMKNKALWQHTSLGNSLKGSPYQWESWASFQVHERKNNCSVKTED